MTDQTAPLIDSNTAGRLTPEIYVFDVFDALYVIEDEVADWAEVAFPEATLETITTHLRREEVELSEASGELLAGELADCWILLAHLRRMIERAEAYLVEQAARVDIDLADEVIKKMKINCRRTWGEPDDEGVVEHVRAEAVSAEDIRRCRFCGCTDRDCSGCVERTGEPCYWAEPDLCSACG